MTALIAEGRELSATALREAALALPLPPAVRGVVPVLAGLDLPSLLLIYALIERGLPFLPLHAGWPAAAAARLVAAVGGTPAQAWVATSGTTGSPSLVPLTRENFAAAATAHAARLPWRSGDRWLLALPPSHVGGLGVLLRCRTAGATVVAAPPGRFEARRISAVIAEHRCTLASLVPTQLARIVAAGCAGPPSLRAVLVGGAACSPSLLTAARALGWPALATYGLTEATGQVATAGFDEPLDGAVGRPLDGVTVTIGADGRITVAGPTVAGGRCRTADLGAIGGDGRLSILGRADDVVVSGGEKIHPAAVEAVLAATPGVALAAVIAVADPEWGQRLEAFIEPLPGAAPAVAEHARSQLAPWQRPRAIHVCPSLPTTPNGKIDRRALRASVE